MESHANWLSTKPVWSVLGSGTGLWLIHKSGLIKGMPRQSYLRFSHTSLIDLFRSFTLQLITESSRMKLQGSGRGQSEKHPSISELPKCFKQGKNPSTVSLSLIFFYLTGKHSRKYQHIMQHEKNMQPYIQVHADWWLCLIFSPPHPVKIVQDDFPGPSSDLLLYYCLFAYSSPANIWVLNQAFFQHWQ